jgi:lysosomal acid lipase/cholesteryl ester hydrolase
LRLTTVLPNLVSDYLVPFDDWNHLDYLWGIDADTLLYPEILKNMETYKQK